VQCHRCGEKEVACLSAWGVGLGQLSRKAFPNAIMAKEISRRAMKWVKILQSQTPTKPLGRRRVRKFSELWR
jgi:hypothetical protein